MGWSGGGGESSDKRGDVRSEWGVRGRMSRVMRRVVSGGVRGVG